MGDTELKVCDFCPFNVWRYGADPTRQTNSTAAIQACYDDAAAHAVLFQDGGHHVCIPDGSYWIGDPGLKLNTTGAARNISLRGGGPLSTVLVWLGASSGTLLEVLSNKYYGVSNLGFKNGLGSKGTTIGVQMHQTAASGGTVTGQTVWNNFVISGFDQGMIGGDTNGNAASELLFLMGVWSQNKHGLILRDANTINTTLVLPIIDHNEIGVYSREAQQLTILGGTGAFNTESDVVIQSAGGYTISGFRTENAGRLVRLEGTSAAAVRLALTGCNAASPTAADDVFIEALNAFALDISACTIKGKIQLDVGNAVYGSFIGVRGSGIASASSAVPYEAVPTTGDLTGLDYDVVGSRQIDTAGLDIARYTNARGVEV